ncbi:MAG: allantoate amidohydrolase [Alphaproteobacteria bacterium]|jgi:allantoate deiminase
MNSPEALARQVMARIDELAAISETPGALTRRYLTDEHRRANELVAGWMTAAGMAAHQDAAGNMVGRYQAARGSGPALLMGSHLDTVVNAGKFDGMLGVLCAIACVQALSRAGRRLSYPIEVIAFADEEGVRFGTTYLGSRAITGKLDCTAFERRDADGISFRRALSEFGLDAENIGQAAYAGREVKAFLELHIEQGPVLDEMHRPAGIVTAINGQTRLSVVIAGQAGHAGTVPMALRRDALAAAAEGVLAVESICAGMEDVVGTVGILRTTPGAINVIPGEVSFTVDVRAKEDGARRDAVARVIRAIRAAAEKRQAEAKVTVFHEATSAPCSPGMMDAIERAMVGLGIEPVRLPSGAGHDAAAMSALCDVGMIFLRSDGGISHDPAERTTEADVAIGIKVMLAVLDQLEG